MATTVLNEGSFNLSDYQAELAAAPGNLSVGTRPPAPTATSGRRLAAAG